VMATAGADQIVVSRTVRDLLLGSGYRFRDLGARALKGVTDEWQLYELESGPI
jgi:class 3 adenylate cyclase